MSRSFIMRYPVVLHSDDGARWGVTVPDLPGCFSAGDSMEQALDSVVEAIDLHLEGLTEDGGHVPSPRPVDEHRANPDFAGGTWALIEIDAGKYEGRAEKINITIPRRILAKVDDYAKSHGLTRSGFLVQAVERAIR
jgi:predicted RNase H-like HicB family nuclease